MTVYLAPDVYWLHDPEDREIFRGTEGDFLPYQQKIKCSYLSLIGLSEHPEDVVIAANKGQSHGCIGNYTMLHFEGDGLYLENLTIGNLLQRGSGVSVRSVEKQTEALQGSHTGTAG